MDKIGKNLNILLINYEYPPVGGGGGVVSKFIAEELVSRGHKVTVLTSKMSGLKFKENVNGVEIYRVPVLGRSEKNAASFFSMITFPIFSIPVGFWICFRNIFDSNKFDLINTHFFAPSGPTGFLLSFIFRIPNLIFAHGADVYDPERINKTPSGKGILSQFLKISAYIQIKTAKSLMTQSSDTKKRIRNLFPDLNMPIEVIPFPFQKPEFNIRNFEYKREGFSIISIGRLVKRKGYDYLVEAIAKLPKDIDLKIIGDGPEKRNLELQITNAKLGNRIKLLGRVSEKLKWEELFSADLYVLSSLHEGMGMVLMEAMYAGLSIVATNEGGQIDLIKDGKNGILIPPKDVDKLAEAIKKMYDDGKLREKFGEINKKEIEKYETSKIGDKYEEYFQNSINK